MMPQDRTGKVPIPVQAEDYDSDESRVVPGTVVTASSSGRHGAQQRHSSSRSRPAERSHGSGKEAYAASDSGYSSQNAQMVTKSPAPAPPGNAAQRDLLRRRSTASPSKKPVIHRHDSAQTQPQLRISTSACSDVNCRDPNCDRRYTLPYRTSPEEQQRYPPAPQYQYAQMVHVQTPAMMMPPPPRPRADSHSRQSRPSSMYAGHSSYSGVQPGPPPSSSAYYYQNQAQQPGIYGAIPATQLAGYAPPSPAYPPSPALPSPAAAIQNTTYPGFPGYATTSARRPDPNTPGLEFPKMRPLPVVRSEPLSRSYSAREAREMRMPDSCESDSGSESEESDSEQEYPRRLREGPETRQIPERRASRAREDMVAVIPARRPSVKDSRKYRTEASVPTRSTRRDSRIIEPLGRVQSDTGLDYPSSSDRNDSDQTTKAILHQRREPEQRRKTVSSTQSSRRPSVSTASSGNTKATSLSSMTENSRVIVETADGRRRSTYFGKLSGREQAEIIRKMEQLKLERKAEEKAEADRLLREKVADYQRGVTGEVNELSAENVKKATRQSYSHANSHVSRRSHRSGGSVTGSKVSNAQGIVIQTGGTVLHVHGDSAVQVTPGQDGTAQITIGNASGRDSTYGGSKSSSSRVGAPCGRNDAIPEYDEAGYEISR